MKKLFFILLPVLVSAQIPGFAQTQRQCGYELNRANLIARDPSWAQKLEAQKASLQGIADNYKQMTKPGAAQRTTSAVSPVPVIFHFCISSGQFDTLGGVAGILARCNSQIAVLNADYNRQNSDSTLIPAGWKSRYASVGIQFGLAHTDPQGFGSPGFEIDVLPAGQYGFSGSYNNYSDVKYAVSGGLNAWDPTKYMNIWCLNFTDLNGLLGLTTFKSETGPGNPFPAVEEGICANYLSVGKRTSPSDYYIPTTWYTSGSMDYYDQGRTITHEVGHFFEIWHTWGDDGGLCPWNGGSDDGLADTPPEGDAHYYNWPDTIHNGTYYDVCRYDGTIDTQYAMYGIASLDYMNYTDDIAMLMFTTDQAAAMASMVLVPLGTGTGATGSGTIGESYSLTQNPNLLQWSVLTSVNGVTGGYSLNIFPNPTTGVVNITFDNTTDVLNQVTVINTVGQQVLTMETQGRQSGLYTIDLSGMGKGMYFINCNFASGSVTRKILLQ